MSLHQDRRAREFWDRVAWTVGDILSLAGPLSTETILGRLPADIRREWAFHGEPITPGTLRENLKERSRWARYVKPAGDDKWQHRPQGDVEGSDFDGTANAGKQRRKKRPGAVATPAS